jgi:hypothetical protein
MIKSSLAGIPRLGNPSASSLGTLPQQQRDASAAFPGQNVAPDAVPAPPDAKVGPSPSLFSRLSVKKAAMGFSLHIDDTDPNWVPFGGIHPDIEEFCEHFQIDERGMQRLNECMTQRRMKTWDDDLARLWEDCSGCHRNPTALVMKKVTDMYNGKFVGSVSGKDADVNAMAKKYKIDREAQKRMEEALLDKEMLEKSQIITEMKKHLEATNSPSKCVMRLLSFVMKGNPMPAAPKPRENDGEEGDEDAQKRALDQKRGGGRDDYRRNDRDNRRGRDYNDDRGWKDSGWKDSGWKDSGWKDKDDRGWKDKDDRGWKDKDDRSWRDDSSKSKGDKDSYKSRDRDGRDDDDPWRHDRQSWRPGEKGRDNDSRRKRSRSRSRSR